MSRGKTPVVSQGAKKQLECYFVNRFPIAKVWEHASDIVLRYDVWHKQQVEAIANYIQESISPKHNAVAVSTKFLNTFMHQLMKYEACRALWQQLHLPLDRRVFKALYRLNPKSLTAVNDHFSESPYSLKYVVYHEIQEALQLYVAELNARPGAGMQLTSRIELNWLWI